MFELFLFIILLREFFGQINDLNNKFKLNNKNSFSIDFI
jgi:hypothetical protein